MNIPTKLIIDSIRTHGPHSHIGIPRGDTFESVLAARVAANRLEEMTQMLVDLRANSIAGDGWTIEMLKRMDEFS